MDIVTMVGAVAAVVAALTGVVAALTGVALLHLRLRDRQSERLPRIEMFEYSDEDTRTCVFRLARNHYSAGWKVIRVEVVTAEPRECLMQYEAKSWKEGSSTLSTYAPTGEWKDHCVYPQGAHEVEHIDFHPSCVRASLTFICKKPTSWWRPLRTKARIKYDYVIGEQPPHWKDPLRRLGEYGSQPL